MCGVVVLMLGVFLLTQSCSCRPSSTDTGGGCLRWQQKGDGVNVCCLACDPGYRIYKECGPVAKDLCTRCEPKTFSKKSNEKRCYTCGECLDPQVIVKDCTSDSDTQCGCKEGMFCEDQSCSYCKKACGKGHQGVNGICRPCPEGTFNNLTDSKCKAWTKTCPKGQMIKAKGDAFTDMQCEDVSFPITIKPDTNDLHVPAWLLVLLVVSAIFLTMIITAVIVKILKERKRFNIKQDTKEPESNIYAEDPRKLIAVECSFHEAEQETDSSSESVDSSGQLVR